MKLGYYSLLDTALLMRQIYSGERFKPFNIATQSIFDKITDEDILTIEDIGKLTNGWLRVIECLMEQVLKGMTSPEELLIAAQREPSILFDTFARSEMVSFFSRIWSLYSFSEMAKHHSKIMETAAGLSNESSTEEMIKELCKRSDRLQLKGSLLSFNIQPRFEIELATIEAIIVMPSIYTTRQVAFWYKENTLLFYVGVNESRSEMREPSDMVLLRTLAVNDKTRLKILKLLKDQAMSINEIATFIGINPSTASRHLKIFKDVGFVDLVSKEGNSQYYILNKEKVTSGLNAIGAYILED